MKEKNQKSETKKRKKLRKIEINRENLKKD